MNIPYKIIKILVSFNEILPPQTSYKNIVYALINFLWQAEMTHMIYPYKIIKILFVFSEILPLTNYKNIVYTLMKLIMASRNDRY